MADAEYFAAATRLLFEAGATEVGARCRSYEGRRYYFLFWKIGEDIFDQAFEVEDEPKFAEKGDVMKGIVLEKLAQMYAAKADR